MSTEDFIMCCKTGCVKEAPYDCGRCHMIFYCSKAHQREDWMAGGHSKKCHEYCELARKFDEAKRNALHLPPSSYANQNSSSDGDNSSQINPQINLDGNIDFASSSLEMELTAVQLVAFAEPKIVPEPTPTLPFTPPSPTPTPAPEKKSMFHLDDDIAFEYMMPLLSSGGNEANLVMSFIKRIRENPNNESYCTIDTSSPIFTSKVAGMKLEATLGLLLLVGFNPTDKGRNLRVFDGSVDSLNAAWPILEGQYANFEQVPNYYSESDLSPDQQNNTTIATSNDNDNDNDNVNDKSNTKTTNNSNISDNNVNAAGGRAAAVASVLDNKITEVDKQLSEETDDLNRCNLLYKKALVHSRDGDYLKATEVFKDCLNLSKSFSGQDSKLTLECTTGLAFAYFSLKEYKLAREYFQEVYDRYKTGSSASPSDITRGIIYRTNLANACALDNQLDEAKSLLVDAYAMAISREDGPKDVRRSLCQNLASISEKLNDFESQKYYLSEALKILEEKVLPVKEENVLRVDQRDHIKDNKDYSKFVDGRIRDALSALATHSGDEVGVGLIKASAATAATTNNAAAEEICYTPLFSNDMKNNSTTTATAADSTLTINVDTASPSVSGAGTPSKPPTEIGVASSSSNTTSTFSTPVGTGADLNITTSTTNSSPVGSQRLYSGETSPIMPSPPSPSPNSPYGEIQMYCSRPGCTSASKFKCKCNVATYCGKECQNLHWKEHKKAVAHPK